LFGSVRQTQLATNQLLSAHKYSLSYHIVSYRIISVQASIEPTIPNLLKLKPIFNKNSQALKLKSKLELFQD